MSKPAHRRCGSSWGRRSPTLVAALNAPEGYDYSHYARVSPAPTKKAGVMSFVRKQELPLAPVILAFVVNVAASLTAALIWSERRWIGTQFMKLAPDGSWKPTGERPAVLYDKESGRTFHKQADGSYLPVAGPQRV